MSELPLGWFSVPLDAVSNLIRGVTYKKDESADHSEEGYLPVLRANNIQNGKLQFDDLVFVLEDNIKDIQKVKKGDIVVAMSSGSKRLVGKSGIAETDFNGGFGAFCGVLRPSQHLNSKYVGLYTLTKEYSDLVSSLSKGVNINNLKPDHFSEINIPIAPLNEQIRIANKLDSVLAKADAAQARLEKIPTLLKRFRQSVLAAATSGELTREWSGVADTKIESNLKVPTGWKVKKASDVCLKVQSGSTPRDKPFEKKGTIPFLKVYNIVNQKIDFDYKPQFVLREVHEKGLKRSIAYPGDVLMNIVGPPLGKVALLTGQYSEWNINQAITLFRANPEVLNPDYLYYVLCEGRVVRELLPETKGQVGQINISLTQCREALIQVPSLEEQNEIVRRVESLFALADAVEKQYLAAKQRLDRLTQSLLAKAFRGELVPQDPNDEPAAELLKRIQAERLAQPSPKHKQSKSA